ncbi:MAG TPA: hypothetical protein VH760_02995 [Gaiellaceae bacterium]
MATPSPQPPKKRPFRWGANDPNHPGLSWWGRWVVRKPPPPGPPPGQKPPAPPS